jgi:predicted RNA-binding protein with EMAP domain
MDIPIIATLEHTPQLKRVLEAAKKVDEICYGANGWLGYEGLNKRDLLKAAAELHVELKRLASGEEE